MENEFLVGYTLAVIVGITLGLTGSGGSILSVPILVYILKIEPVLATAYSLFVVGTTALVGGYQKAKQGLVDFYKAFLFGIPTIIAVFITRKFIIPSIPEVIFSTGSFTLHKSVLVMVVFAIVMIFASIRMLKPLKEKNEISDIKLNYKSFLFQGLFIGLIAGFVGAGGGFLIVPTLLFLGRTPMKVAVGTSLIIVSAQSLIGFIGDICSEQNLDWNLILTFTSCSLVGIFIGSYVSKKVDSEKLKTGFGWFVLSMGIYIIFKELILS